LVSHRNQPLLVDYSEVVLLKHNLVLEVVYLDSLNNLQLQGVVSLGVLLLSNLQFKEEVYLEELLQQAQHNLQVHYLEGQLLVKDHCLDNLNKHKPHNKPNY
jgi:hypothetical protein